VPESCAAHDKAGWANEMLWQASLDPGQDGLFWCEAGRHYVRVPVLALSVLAMMLASLPLLHGPEYLGGTS